MQILFLHPNFPAQYRHVALALSQDSRNRVIFGTKNQDVNLAGIEKAIYTPTRDPHPETHHYVRTLESAVLQGQAVFRMLIQLKQQGFVPDIVCGHSGWGPTLFVKDLFPKTPLLCYFEWFYHARGSDADFDPSEPLGLDDLPRIRVKNSPILLDLYSCDYGLSPTQWQRSQFPPEFQSKISTLHDGVDTDYFVPKPGSKLVLPELDLSHAEELVTYVARGMEPYRGFPQFMEAIAHLQEKRPKCHVVIVGSERVCYGKNLPDGRSYKDLMLEKVSLDLSRVHFAGSLPYGQYLKVLQASDVHVYLTRPFVLSWSMIESMSAGCLVLGSSTAPVQEVIEDGKNGLLVDFFSPVQIAERICEVLEHPTRMQELRDRARQTVLDRYALAKLLPQHLKLIRQVASGEAPAVELKKNSSSKSKKGFG
jgi:glycosyltransferase involved in cell wall biosynthesis